MSLLARLKQGKQQPQGDWQATLTALDVTTQRTIRTTAVWVERNVRPVPTFDHPRVGTKELSHG